MCCDDDDDAARASYISHYHVPNNAVELGMGGGHPETRFEIRHRGGFGRTMRIYKRLHGRRPRENQTIIQSHVQAIYLFYNRYKINYYVLKVNLFKFKHCSKGKQ